MVLSWQLESSRRCLFEPLTLVRFPAAVEKGLSLFSTLADIFVDICGDDRCQVKLQGRLYYMHHGLNALEADVEMTSGSYSSSKPNFANEKHSLQLAFEYIVAYPPVRPPY